MKKIITSLILLSVVTSCYQTKPVDIPEFKELPVIKKKTTTSSTSDKKDETPTDTKTDEPKKESPKPSATPKASPSVSATPKPPDLKEVPFKSPPPASSGGSTTVNFTKYKTILSPTAFSILSKVTDPSVTNPDKSTVPFDSMVTTNNKFIRSYVDGAQIFQGVKDLISTAKYEIAMVTFIWESESEAVKLFGEGLKLAEKNLPEGKKLIVRIIINDFQLDPAKNAKFLYNARKAWDLDENKVDVQLAVYPHFAFGAMHTKYFVVDGRFVMMTGANMETVNDNNANMWHDMGYLFEGELAKSVLSDFDDSWSKHAIYYDCKNRTIIPDCVRDTAPKILPRTFLPLATETIGTLPIIALSKQASENPNDKDDNPQNQGWLTAIDNASSINIQTPNINDDSFQNAIIEAVKKGSSVKINTGKKFNELVQKLPAQGGSNEDVVYNLRKKLRAEGINDEKLIVKWYSKDGTAPIVDKPNACHIKYMNIDSKITIIGSGNMDTQTWNHSREFNLLIDNEQVTKDIEGTFFNKDWQNGVLP